MKSNLIYRLSQNNLIFLLWAGFASFLAYFCMYMYRKPYTAGTFEEFDFFDVDYKIILVISQVLGYALSKFLGIKVISELDNKKRIRLFIYFIGTAWLALVGFAYTPPAFGPVFLFINGIPLGMIWGIVFSYCEGRRITEFITVLISANFILSSGIAKSWGTYLLNNGYSSQEMPMMIGLFTIPLLVLSLWMLSKIPPPSPSEIAYKQERLPMTKEDKKHFLKKYWFVLTLFVLLYLILTIIRDIRDNFAVEIWTGLGYDENPQIFTTTEIPVALLILLSLGLLYKIRDNKKALLTNVLISILGISLLLFTTFAYSRDFMSPVSWMIISGIGLFLPYILLNGIIFDRFIAHYKIVGNVGFIMYISDAFGYLGSVLIMLYKNFGNADIEWLSFYQSLCFTGGSLGLFIVLGLYFIFKSEIITKPEPGFSHHLSPRK